MNPRHSIWLSAMQQIRAYERGLLSIRPPELPGETDPTFWKIAAALEARHRGDLSSKLRRIVEGAAFPCMTSLQSWLFRKRIEWASQLILAKAQRGTEPEAMLPDVLKWLLIESWETDGWIAFAIRAQAGGKPHPDNPEGLTPL